jgi:hypothetical protein
MEKITISVTAPTVAHTALLLSRTNPKSCRPNHVELEFASGSIFVRRSLASMTRR